MNIYPAIKGRMGRWHYFVVKMSMRELADNVKFAADIYDDRTLDQAIQRVLEESRVKKDIITYLIRQPDRFFSSVVVAALRGDPKWYPVTMEEDERFILFREDKRLNETFGVLSFDGKQDYYALDGQHRLAAIRALVDPTSDVSPDAPSGFKDEEISVIVVVPMEAETDEEFLKRYRRLFGNLNRYAKPMDQVTNIIMDEDDAFAIVTRRLISEHEFFHYSGRQKDSAKIKTRKGKNLKTSDSFFTSLETLYLMNISLLSSNERKNKGWNTEGERNYKEFRKYRPDEEYLDSLFEELKLYWDGLLEELPVLREEPSKMRNHSSPSGKDGTQDNVLFWPICQEILADIARDLLNKRQITPATPTPQSIREALSGLGDLTWNFHEPPWRNLLLVPKDQDSLSWRIRSEDRKYVMLIAKEIIKWQLGLLEYATDEIKDLYGRWSAMLLPALESDEIEELWDQIQNAVHR